MRGALREAGRIAAAARDHGARLIRPGSRLLDVCDAVESFIRERGGACAFPVQTSLNAVAAHDCPAPGDTRVYAKGDLAKLDVGVHVDGWVVDTALTVGVGDAGDLLLVEATRAALVAALDAAGPGVPVSQVSNAISQAITAAGAKPVRNIGGHGVARFTVHCPPSIPNVPEAAAGALATGMVVAIEPFATRGEGLVVEQGLAEVFRFEPGHSGDPDLDPELMRALRETRGLPFSRRQLSGVAPQALQAGLAFLAATGGLHAYAPLVEVSGMPVAQTEHTAYVGTDGIELLT